MNSKKSLRSVSLFILLGLCLILIGYVAVLSNRANIVKIIPSPTPAEITTQFTIAKVIKVYDGDTIQIEGGLKVRYIGIDSAEVYPGIQCYSEEAKRQNEKLVLGKEIKLIKDVSETDKYGRLLSYVYVGDEFVNNELVRSGFAKVMTVPPDIKYQNLFQQSEKHAKDLNLGLWSKCF